MGSALLLTDGASWWHDNGAGEIYAQRTENESGRRSRTGGDRKKEWKSEMNDGGNLGFPAMTFEVGRGVEVGGSRRGAATRSQLKGGECMELMAQAASGNVDGEEMYPLAD